jgi:hypothetical protein
MQGSAPGLELRFARFAEGPAASCETPANRPTQASLVDHRDARNQVNAGVGWWQVELANHVTSVG